MRYLSILLLAFVFSSATGQSRIDFYQFIEDYIETEEFDKIIALENDAVEYTMPVDSLSSDILSIYGETYLILGEFDQSIDYFQKAINIREQLAPKITQAYADLLYNLISAYMDAGQLGKARETSELLLQVDEELNGTKSVAYFESSLYYSDILVELGEYDAALKVLKKLGRQVTEPFNVAVVNAAVGNVYSLLGNYQTAEQRIADAALTFDKQGDKLNYEISRNSMALNYINQGRYPEAEVVFLQARDNLSEIEGTDYYIQDVNSNLALAQMALGRSDQAIELYTALLVSDSIQYGLESADYITSLINLGTAYHDVKNFDRSLAVLQRAAELAPAVYGDDSEVEATILNNMGNVHRDSGNLTEAVQYYNRARNIYEKREGKNSANYATSTFNQGRAQLLNKSAEAESLLQEALKIRKKMLGEKHPKYAEATNYLGIYYWQKGDLKKARKYFEDTFVNYFGQIRNVFPVLSEEEKTKFYLEKLKPAFEQYNSLAEQVYSDDPTILSNLYNYQLKTKGVIMLATERLRNRIAASKDTILVNKYELWKSSKERLSKLYANNDPRVALTDSLAALSNKLERELTQQSSDFANAYAATPDWKSVQSSLKDGEVALEIIRYRVADPQQAGKFSDNIHYLALAIDKNSETPRATLLTRGNLVEGRYLNNYRNSIKYQITDNFTYDEMWTPLRTLFGQSRKVYISPDGAYNQINLSTLVNPKTGDYLIKEYDIQEVTSTRDLVATKEQGTSSNAHKKFLFGFPTYTVESNASVDNATRSLRGGTRGVMRGGGNSYSATRGLRGGLLRYMRSGESIATLPGTKTEVEKIEQILDKEDTEAYLSEHANESKIKNIKNPETLHIATHGYFLANISDPEFGESNRYYQNPLLRSGLILAGAEDFLLDGTNPLDTQDGILTAYEVMNMDLTGTDLVVLSACETGLGEVRNGEGVYGLQRAFKIAGADYIVMSMWNVDDDATQKLMTLFYDRLADNQPKYEAFRSAQLALMEEYDQPFYWGAFKIVGD